MIEVVFRRIAKRFKERKKPRWPKELLIGTVVELKDFYGYDYSECFWERFEPTLIDGGLFTIVGANSEQLVIMRYHPSHMGMINHIGAANHWTPPTVFNVEEQYMIPIRHKHYISKNEKYYPEGKGLTDSIFVRIHRAPSTRVLPQGTMIRVNPKYRSYWEHLQDTTPYHINENYYQGYLNWILVKDALEEDEERKGFPYNASDYEKQQMKDKWVKWRRCVYSLGRWAKVWYGGVPLFMEKKGGLAEYLFGNRETGQIDGMFGWNQRLRTSESRYREDLTRLHMFECPFIPHWRQSILRKAPRTSNASPIQHPPPLEYRNKDMRKWMENMNCTFLVGNSSSLSDTPSTATLSQVKSSYDGESHWTTNIGTQYLVPMKKAKNTYKPYKNNNKKRERDYHSLNFDSLTLGFFVQYGIFEVVDYRPELFKENRIIFGDRWKAKNDDETSKDFVSKMIPTSTNPIPDTSGLYAPIFYKDWMGEEGERWSKLPRYKVVGKFDPSRENPNRGMRKDFGVGLRPWLNHDWKKEQ